MDKRAPNASAPYIIFTCGLSICAFLLLHRLGHDDISQWDEIVHVNVVHNLSVDGRDPKLHSVDLGTDFEDSGDPSFKPGDLVWTNNYIWLHKPLLPFYLRAALCHALGESLFVFRLPSALFALLTSVSLFFIAKRLSNAWVATGVALLFASNRFVFELVQGRQFSDLSDVMNVFSLTIVLGLALGVAAGRPLFFSKKESAPAYFAASLAAALFSALAYSCKGGLALPGLSVFAIALVWQCSWRRGLGYAVLLGLVFGALVCPEYFYFSHRFPREFHYEQRQHIAHLFTDVEGWARPWHYYLTFYWQLLLGLPLGCLGLLAMIASVLCRPRHRSNVLLVLWILSYLVPLSFGVSKVANFILPVLPAVLLLVGLSAYDLFRSERRTLLSPVTEILFLAFLGYYFLQYAKPFTQRLGDLAGAGYLVLCVSCGLFAGFRLLSIGKTMLGSAPSSTSPVPARIAVAMMAFMGLSVIIQTSKINWTKSNRAPANYEEQMAIKATAEAMKQGIPPDAVVLVDEESEGDHRNAHLYFQYWSGFNSLPARQLAFAKRTLSPTHPLYLLNKRARTDGDFMGTLPYGYLYRID